MRMKVKRISLVTCLFLFQFVVIGNALHLNPAGAFLAAATGTPLLIYVFDQRAAARTAIHRHSPGTRGQAGGDGLNHDRGHPPGNWENDSASRQ
jgi:hypothetical protein